MLQNVDLKQVVNLSKKILFVAHLGKRLLGAYVNSKDPDKPGHLCRLIFGSAICWVLLSISLNGRDSDVQTDFYHLYVLLLFILIRRQNQH